MTLRDQLTDAQRDEVVTEILTALSTSEIPHHLRDGLVRYFRDGILPGSFLQAVLCNDLAAAVLRGAPGALFALPSLVNFLVGHAPLGSWGARAIVLAWTTTPDRLEV